ncbi:MAG: hypothetical protein R3C20_06625 [Planctomycetaceae bacterium]
MQRPLQQPEFEFSGMVTARHGSPGLRRSIFVVLVGFVLLVWLCVLPRVAQTESFSQQMRFFDSRGIDPSARYYTDQPAGWKNADAMADKMRESPEAFWQFSQASSRTEARQEQSAPPSRK